jgi:succinate dehydrogenase/fumarate reductase cytochrome b subunit
MRSTPRSSTADGTSTAPQEKPASSRQWGNESKTTAMEWCLAAVPDRRLAGDAGRPVASRHLRPCRRATQSSVTLRALHRSSACVLIVFAILHIGNHLAALHGIHTHLAVMEALRGIYRRPAVEVLLLFLASFQAVSGLAMVVRGWAARHGRVAWLQALSGTYLAIFLVVHVGAVLFGRSALGLDTNFYFAAAGFHVPPYGWFFAPYYFLAVLALFAHLGCAFYWWQRARAPRRARAGLFAALVAGSIASLAICLSLAGLLRPVFIPAEYKATYGAQ